MHPSVLHSAPSLRLESRERLEVEPDWVSSWEVLSQQGTAILLESGGPPSEAGRWTFLAGRPLLEVRGNSHETSWAGVSRPIGPTDKGSFLDFLDEVGKPGVDPSFPSCLAQGWFGALGYGSITSLCGPQATRWSVEKDADLKASEHHFFKPGLVLAFDRMKKELFRFGGPVPVFDEKAGRSPLRITQFSPRDSKARYEEMVRKAQGYISRGDIYQANLAQSFEGRMEGGAAVLYRALRRLNPGPFMGLFRSGDRTLVSSSPERLAVAHEGWLESRPIAGTRPRGSSSSEDERLKLELEGNEKERAEHLMLVDLARNDLGKVAEYGTVEVTRFAEVESYARVHHLVSTVRAELRQGVPLGRIIEAVFPGGTITGCPKVRCMEVIDEIEGRPRGFYTGSMGYIAPGPCFDLNILIRTFTCFPDGRFDFFAGAGIVADSDPGREYQETLFKVEALAAALGKSLLQGE